MLRKPAVFFDRDGVLNVDKAYLYRIEDFQWIDGAKDAVRFLNDAGYYVFVFTNQSGVARGFFEEDDIRTLHDWMQGELNCANAHIDDFVYCPHHPDAERPEYRQDCRCRKPAPGMIEQLLEKWPVDLARSFVVGDRQRDLDAGAALGLPGLLFTEGRLDTAIKDMVRRFSATDDI